jgi:hypothetical protein
MEILAQIVGTAWGTAGPTRVARAGPAPQQHLERPPCLRLELIDEQDYVERAARRSETQSNPKRRVSRARPETCASEVELRNGPGAVSTENDSRHRARVAHDGVGGDQHDAADRCERWSV